MKKVKVIKKNTYFTIVAAKRILTGETLIKIEGTVSSLPNKYSVQIGVNEHLTSFSDDPKDESSFFRFINHSCSPNACFDIPNRSLIALRDISENEEVVFHYCTTEYEMASPFQCLCQTAGCLVEIKGFKYLSDEKKKELFAQLAPHLKIS